MIELAKTTTQVTGPQVPAKLTTEEMNSRYQFIGRCVDRGINFPSSNKFGVIGALSVQDLCNSNIRTLQDIAVKIKKEQADHDPEFNGTEELKINAIKADDWLAFLRLTIRKKLWDAYAAKIKTDKRVLQTAIDTAKTPEELRREAEVKLAQLNAIGGIEEE